MRQPFALSETDKLRGLMQTAGFTEIALTQRSRVVGFGPRADVR